MKRAPSAAAALVRNRVIRVQSIVDLVERLDELETGVPEHVGQAPALHEVLDRLERDVMSLAASRLDRPSAAREGD